MPKLSLAIMLSISVMILPNSFAVLDDQLVLYLSFDEGKGQAAKDASKHKNNGTLHKAGWDKGEYGNAVKLTGDKGGWVEVPDSTSLDITDEITIAHWIYPTKFTDEWNRIVVKTWKGDTDPWMIYGTYQVPVGDFADTSGKTGFNVFADDEARWGHTDEALKVDTWTHMAATYDGKVLKIYYNGKVKMETKGSGKIDTNDVPVSIGRNSEGNREHYVGLIDEVAIWNKALTQAQINQAMKTVLDVEATDKLPTCWGQIKGLYID